MNVRNAFPRISFGDWVGGDRDGHPLVTAEVTHNTLLQLRLNAFVVIKRKMNLLVQRLSFACSMEDILPAARLRMEEMVVEMGERGPEYLQLDLNLVVPQAKQHTVNIALKRWIHIAERKW